MALPPAGSSVDGMPQMPTAFRNANGSDLIIAVASWNLLEVERATHSTWPRSAPDARLMICQPTEARSSALLKVDRKRRVAKHLRHGCVDACSHGIRHLGCLRLVFDSEEFAPHELSACKLKIELADAALRVRHLDPPKLFVSLEPACNCSQMPLLLAGERVHVQAQEWHASALQDRTSAESGIRLGEGRMAARERASDAHSAKAKHKDTSRTDIDYPY
eukprot:CAMPEP_0183358592 /NCGR_PEP_ID=MMETSP0164_2-20130417/49715_1 /TAXON_ID=221442 /ORGANISM="Coccolithus pelagicus ssp braarudi, Strain PLY182g" /LENGTH=218 /DNA_ID=CAMNT_0025532515 /DNA_START=86 /DNA_END=741 /DNA_ORIENTATION=-